MATRPRPRGVSSLSDWVSDGKGAAAFRSLWWSCPAWSFNLPRAAYSMGRGKAQDMLHMAQNNKTVGDWHRLASLWRIPTSCSAHLSARLANVLASKCTARQTRCRTQLPAILSRRAVRERSVQRGVWSIRDLSCRNARASMKRNANVI